MTDDNNTSTDNSTDSSNNPDPSSGSTASNDPSAGADYFTDSAQMDAMVKDARSQDTRSVSTKDDAKKIIASLKTATDTSPWTSISRSEVADRLSDIIDNARLIYQGNLNLCGPASLIFCWSQRDPVAFAQFASDLYNNGKASIGSIDITPTKDLLNNYPVVKDKITTHAADWLVLGAIRNSTDKFWQGTWEGDPSQGLSGLTRPEELAGWLKATGVYQDVVDAGNWVSTAGLPQAENLTAEEGSDNILLINSLIISQSDQGDHNDDESFLAKMFPNHYVVLLNEIVHQQNTGDPGTVTLSIWTWASNKIQMKVPMKVFIDNYYGSITAKMPPKA